jgi:hypothetical protein
MAVLTFSYANTEISQVMNMLASAYLVMCIPIRMPTYAKRVHAAWPEVTISAEPPLPFRKAS